MRRCSYCLEEQPKANFYKKGNGLQTMCKLCTSKRNRETYNRKKQYYLDKAYKWREICREIIRQAKNVPCKDCGSIFPYFVMHFDHLMDKKFNISRATTIGIKKLKAEIAKCEVVCANCHAFRTYKRQFPTETI